MLWRGGGLLIRTGSCRPCRHRQRVVRSPAQARWPRGGPGQRDGEAQGSRGAEGRACVPSPRDEHTGRSPRCTLWAVPPPAGRAFAFSWGRRARVLKFDSVCPDPARPLAPQPLSHGSFPSGRPPPVPPGSALPCADVAMRPFAEACRPWDSLTRGSISVHVGGSSVPGFTERWVFCVDGPEAQGLSAFTSQHNAGTREGLGAPAW